MKYEFIEASWHIDPEKGLMARGTGKVNRHTFGVIFSVTQALIDSGDFQTVAESTVRNQAEYLYRRDWLKLWWWDVRDWSRSWKRLFL